MFIMYIKDCGQIVGKTLKYFPSFSVLIVSLHYFDEQWMKKTSKDSTLDFV